MAVKRRAKKTAGKAKRKGRASSGKGRKLNIAHLHWGFPPIVGGVETHLEIMLPHMARLGHKVSLLTGSTESAKPEYSYKGIQITRSPLMELNWLYRRGLQGLDHDINKMYNAFIDKARPHVIHCHNMHYFSKPHIVLLEAMAKKKGIPLVLTAHNVWDDILFLELTLKINWSHIIAVSHFIKKELIGVGCDDHKVTVIHHGIDTDMFRPNIDTDPLFKKYPQLKNKRIVFHPARMGLAKGCDVSIKAINMVRHRFPRACLVLAGTKNIVDWGEHQEKDIAYMVSLVKVFGLQKNVLIDSFTLEEMARIYAACDVSLYPSSVGEPFGLTMLESMSAAKAMIVTDAGGMPEIIRDGINGFVIPVRDAETLASRIIQLLANDRLRRRLGATGRQMAMAQYTTDIVTANNIDIYRNLSHR